MQGPTEVLETVSEKGCATTRIPNTQHKDIKPKERAQQRVFLHIRGQHLGTFLLEETKVFGQQGQSASTAAGERRH